MGLLSFLYSLLERLRFIRYKSQEAMRRHGVLIELLNRAWRTLVLLIIAIVATVSVDALIVPRLFAWAQGTWMATATGHLQNLLESNVATYLLAAIVTGMAALVAIVFSLSILSYQMTARRFGDSTAAFLMREEVTSYVLDFALFSLLYSTWALFLHRSIVSAPLFGIMVSVLLTTLAVVFLATYRLHTFTITQAMTIADRLCRVVAKQWEGLTQSRRFALGPSIENFLRLKASEALDQLRSISMSLLDEQKPHEPALVTLPAMMGLLYYYPQAKRHIRPDSYWYPRIMSQVREQEPGYIDLKRIFQDLALGQPRIEQVKRDWLEERVFRTLKEIRKSAEGQGLMNNLYSLSFGYQQLAIHSFESQEIEVVDKCMYALEELGQWGVQWPAPQKGVQL